MGTINELYGERVLVQGYNFGGVLVRVVGDLWLVKFDNGRQEWVDADKVQFPTEYDEK